MTFDVAKYIERERAKGEGLKAKGQESNKIDLHEFLRSVNSDQAGVINEQPVDTGERLSRSKVFEVPDFDPESLVTDSFALATAESTERQGQAYREPIEPAIKEMSKKAARKFERLSIVDRILGGDEDQQAKETAKAINQLWIDSEVRKHGRQGAMERFEKIGGEDPWLSVFVSGFTGGESRNMLEQVMSPMSRFSARTAGSLAKIMLLGTAINPAMGELGEKLNLGSKAIRALSQYGGSAATLGSSAAADVLVQVAEGKDITAWDATKMILSSAGFGLAYGAAGEVTGKISSPFLKIPADAATGYVAAKLTGGDDEEAALMALTFAGLGILHGPRNLTDKEFAWNRFSKQYGQYMERTKGIPANKAEAMFRKLEPMFRKEAEKMGIAEIDGIIRAMKQNNEIYFQTIKPANYQGKAQQPSAGAPAINAAKTKPLEAGKGLALPEHQGKPIRPDATLPSGTEPIITPKPDISAKFIGYQKNAHGIEEVPLFNITGGPKDGLTVSKQTLMSDGIEVPNHPKPKPVNIDKLVKRLDKLGFKNGDEVKLGDNWGTLWTAATGKIFIDDKEIYPDDFERLEKYESKTYAVELNPEVEEVMGAAELSLKDRKVIPGMTLWKKDEQSFDVVEKVGTRVIQDDFIKGLDSKMAKRIFSKIRKGEELTSRQMVTFGELKDTYFSGKQEIIDRLTSEAVPDFQTLDEADAYLVERYRLYGGKAGFEKSDEFTQKKDKLEAGFKAAYDKELEHYNESERARADFFEYGSDEKTLADFEKDPEIGGDEALRQPADGGKSKSDLAEVQPAPGGPAELKSQKPNPKNQIPKPEKYQAQVTIPEIPGIPEDQLKVVKRLLPEAGIRIVRRIQKPEGTEVLGQYLNGVITISENPKETTGYHEVVHGYLDMYVGKFDRNKIFDDYRQKAKGEGQTDDEVEERIAEEFYEYYQNNAKPKSFLRRLFEKIKAVIDRLLGKADRVKALYKDIIAQKRPKTGQNRPAVALSYQERGKAPTFFSQAEKVVENKFPAKMSGNSVMNWLKNNQVKPEELEWLDVEGFVGNKLQVTKEQLLDFIRQNDVQVEEVVKSTDIKKLNVRESAVKGSWIAFDGDDFLIPGIKADTEEKALQLAQKILDSNKLIGGNLPKFAQYQEPGGTNYRELLLTMPVFKRRAKVTTLTGEDKGEVSVPDMASAFTTSHFTEPNVLAHVRFNERTDADGNKVLFVEEVQSDWAQKIKNESLSVNSESKIPNMPFKSEKSWSMLVMKRMIRWAAENGFDRIAWTTGEMQVKRYDLSKQVDSIDYSQDENGYHITIYPNKGGPIEQDVKTEGKLRELIGKDISNKIIKGEGIVERDEDGAPLDDEGRVKTLRGFDLKVGGEGMKSFYDQKVPAWVNKYVKKWGSQVQSTKFKVQSKEIEVPAITITPEMKSAVLYEGQAKFQKDSGKQIDKVVDWLESQIPEGKRGDIERHHEATLLRQKIAYIKRGYRLGQIDKKKEFKWLQSTIRNYAKKHLPQTNMTRGQVVPVLTSLEHATTIQDIEKAWQRIDEIRTKVDRMSTLDKVMNLIDNYQPKTTAKNRRIGTTLTPVEYAKMTDIKVLVKMSRNEVSTQLQGIVEKAIAGDRDPDYNEQEAIYLATVFGDLKHKGPEEIRNALDEINHIIDTGRSRHRMKVDKQREEDQGEIDRAVHIVTGGKGLLSEDEFRERKMDKKRPLRKLDDYQHAFEWSLDKLERFDKSSDPLEGWLTRNFTDKVHDATVKEAKGTREAMEYLHNKLEEIYSKHKGKLKKEVRSNNARTDTNIIIQKDGKPIKLQISQNEAYKRWLEWLDPSLHVHRNKNGENTWDLMGYDKELMEHVENFIRPEVKEWAEFQINEFYPKNYYPLNEEYKKHNFVDLPYNAFYTPTTRDVKGDREEDQLLRAKYMNASIYFGHMKSRVPNVQPLKYRDGDNVLVQHILECEHYKAWADVVREMKVVLQSQKVQKAILQYHGRSILKHLNKMIDDLIRGGVDRMMVLDTVDKYRANFSVAVIGVPNVTPFYKQLTSFPAYWVSIPIKEWNRGITKFLLHPKRAIKILNQSEWIKARYKSGWSFETTAVMWQNTASRLADAKSFKQHLMVLTKLGDRAAIYIGGYPVYDYYLKKYSKTMSPEEAQKSAMRKFEVISSGSQQSGEVYRLPPLLRSGSFGKLFGQFMISQNSYYQHASGAWRNIRAGRGSLKDNLKRFIIFNFLLPQLFQWAADGFGINWKRQLRTLFAGNSLISGMFIAGDAVETITRYMTGESWDESLSVPVLDPIKNYSIAMRRIYKMTAKIIEGDEITLEDVLKATDELAKGVGKQVGVGYESGRRAVKNVSDYASGKDRDIRRLLQYSEYALKKEKGQGQKAKAKVKDSTRAAAYRKLIESSK